MIGATDGARSGTRAKNGIHRDSRNYSIHPLHGDLRPTTAVREYGDGISCWAQGYVVSETSEEYRTPMIPL